MLPINANRSIDTAGFANDFAIVSKDKRKFYAKIKRMQSIWFQQSESSRGQKFSWATPQISGTRWQDELSRPQNKGNTNFEDKHFFLPGEGVMECHRSQLRNIFSTSPPSNCRFLLFPFVCFSSPSCFGFILTFLTDFIIATNRKKTERTTTCLSNKRFKNEREKM